MLAHDAYGRGDGPAVVLLHGWPLNRAIWSEVAARVASAGFRVLCPDLPGFGGSPPLEPARWSVEAFADEVALFLETHAPGPIAVAGHSFGGYVALALADRGPRRLAGLGLVSSRTTADTEAAREGRRATAARVRAEGSAALLPDLAERLLAPAADPALRERAASVVRASAPEAVVAGLAAMAARPDRTGILARLGRPLLVLHGSADQLIPVTESARPLRPAFPVTRVVLAGVGHMPMWEDPARVSGAVAAWAQAVHGAEPARPA